MGNNHVKALGVRPEGTVGTAQFNQLWEVYKNTDDAVTLKNVFSPRILSHPHFQAKKFLKDLSAAVKVDYSDDLAQQLIEGVLPSPDAEVIHREAFLKLLADASCTPFFSFLALSFHHFYPTSCLTTVFDFFVELSLSLLILNQLNLLPRNERLSQAKESPSLRP